MGKELNSQELQTTHIRNATDYIHVHSEIELILFFNDF